jgi:hypothetical protein
MLVGVEGAVPPAWGHSPQTPFLQLIRLGYLESNIRNQHKGIESLR